MTTDDHPMTTGDEYSCGDPCGEPGASRFAAVAEHLAPGSRVIASRRLAGGVSADVHALEFRDPEGQARTVVVRQLGGASWKTDHERIARREHQLMEALHRAGLPVPEPLWLDTSGQVLPGPYLVMAFVPGTTTIPDEQLPARLDTMARTLARVHDLAIPELPPLPARLDPLPELHDFVPPGDVGDEVRAALADLGDTRYHGRPCLLHGDYWPENMIWQDDRIAALLDWEDAALGDPLSDVAGCRLELTWRHGADARDRFTAAYAAARPVDLARLALWDIYVACAACHFMDQWGLPADQVARMRTRAEEFVREAVGRVGSR